MRSRSVFLGFIALACAGLFGYTASARRAPAPKEAAKRAAPTFTKDIAPIVFKNCASCHRPGEVAPFPLLTYQDVKKRAAQIGLVTKSRFMPPWHADSHGEFADERRLTEQEIATFAAWSAANAPEGAKRDLPPAPRYTFGWRLGEPDAVFEPGETYTVGAEGRDVYRNFVIPTNYAEDRYVSAVEVRPGNRSVVHHVLVFLDSSGAARKLDERDPGPGYSTFGGVGFIPSGGLGGWAPGNLPRHLPEGVGNLLPKGTDLVLQVHYHKTGKTETDRTKIGIYFCKKPVDKRVHTAMVINPWLSIPPGEANHPVQAALPVLTDVTVLNITPHMHLLGREMTVTATLPDGAKKPLVRVPNWNFNWQTTYTYKEPLKLPQGAHIDLAARYDNSPQNPFNPSSPPKRVTWGEQTTDEMCIAFLGFTVDSEHLTRGISAGNFGFGIGRRGTQRRGR